MRILIEAIFLNFSCITGIERHLFLQLEIFEKLQCFEKIYIVVKKPVSPNLPHYELDIEFIDIVHNDSEEWANIYKTKTFDLIYSTFVPPPVLPSTDIPIMYVLHDPGRYLYPELMESGTLDEHISRFAEYAKNQYFYVITVSESSQTDILRFFPHLKNRIFVVYNFISHVFGKLKRIKACYQIEDDNRFFLTIGRFSPTKNTLAVVKAFEQRSDIFADYRLFIIGRQGWYRDLEDYLEEYSNKSDIVLLSNISDIELFKLYRSCYSLISASIYEGFGLPLVEAAFCGCERIFCSDIPVYHELNLEASIYFNPHDYNDLSVKAFKKYIPPIKYSEDNLKKFTIDSVSKQLYDIIMEIIYE